MPAAFGFRLRGLILMLVTAWSGSHVCFIFGVANFLSFRMDSAALTWLLFLVFRTITLDAGLDELLR